jgi:hypothetical protein
VGVDPGTTVGLAILDLEGTVMNVFSARNFSLYEISEYIPKFGYPVIIATDVSPPPTTVARLSHNYDARLFFPSQSISVEEKNAITAGHTTDNFHQRDALTAALKAYNHYEGKFRNIDAKLSEMGLREHSERLKMLVLHGYNLKRAIELLFIKKEEGYVENPSPKIEVLDIQRKLYGINLSFARLQKYKEELDLEIEMHKKTIEGLKEKIRTYDRQTKREVFSSEGIASRDNLIKSLREELVCERERNHILLEENEVLKRMRILELSEGALPVKIIRHFSVEEIKIYDEKFRIKEGDIVYFRDASGGGTTTAHEVARHKVTCILVSGSMSHLARTVFEKVGIPVFNAEEFEMKCVENYGVTKAEKFEEKMKEWRMKRSIDEAEKASENLKTIIEEYKKERNEEISNHLEK